MCWVGESREMSILSCLCLNGLKQGDVDLVVWCFVLDGVHLRERRWAFVLEAGGRRQSSGLKRHCVRMGAH